MPQMQGHPHLQKQKPGIKLKSQTKPHTLIVGDLNTPLSPLDLSVRQNINREIRKLTDVMTKWI